MIQYSLDEVTIKPCGTPTDISSRSEVNPYREGKLPIFVAPMTSVVNKDNWKYFADEDRKIIPIIPRGILPYADEINKDTWKAVSLKEFEDMVVSDKHPAFNNILIDMANGHIKKMYTLCAALKRKYSDVKLMVGNIANANILYYAAMSGVDYIRCGIGGGSACTTHVRTSIGTSLETLLRECKVVLDVIKNFPIHAWRNNPEYSDDMYVIWHGLETAKSENIFRIPEIIADGGINTIAKGIKCLALGADYIMMGSMFAHCIESANVIYAKTLEEAKTGLGYDRETAHSIIEYGKGLDPSYKPFSKYYGMASKEGAQDLGKGTIQAPEGISTWYECNYSLDEFESEFEAYLRSAMTYTGSHNLDEFKNVETCIQSENEFKAYNK